MVERQQFDASEVKSVNGASSSRGVLTGAAKNVQKQRRIYRCNTLMRRMESSSSSSTRRPIGSKSAKGGRHVA